MPKVSKYRESPTKPLGVIHPLPLAGRRWSSALVNFATLHCKKRAGFDAVTTFVDSFSKCIHPMPPMSTYNGTDAADSYFNYVFKLHGLPDSVISDKDPRFTVHIWSQSTNLNGTKLRMGTSRLFRTEGSTNKMNRIPSKISSKSLYLLPKPLGLTTILARVCIHLRNSNLTRHVAIWGWSRIKL